MAADKPKSFPKLILVFLPVDWPMFMRKKAIVAVAEVAEPLGATVVAANRPSCPVSTWFKKPHRIIELLGRQRMRKIERNLYLLSPRYFIHDLVASKSKALQNLDVWALRRRLLTLLDRSKRVV